MGKFTVLVVVISQSGVDEKISDAIGLSFLWFKQYVINLKKR